MKKEVLINIIKVSFFAVFSFVIMVSLYFFTNRPKTYYAESPQAYTYTPINFTVTPQPLIEVTSPVSYNDKSRYATSLMTVSHRGELFHESLLDGNYVGYGSKQKYNGTIDEKTVQKMVNIQKIYTSKVQKYGQYFGVTLNKSFTLETVDPDLNWSGVINYTDQIDQVPISTQIDGVSYVQNDEGKVEARLRVANSYIGDGKNAGGIFFIRTSLNNAFNLIEQGEQTFSYITGFRDSLEKLHNIKTGIDLISEKIGQDTSTDGSGAKELSMIDLSRLNNGPVAVANYMEGWAAVDDRGVRSLGGGVCAAISGQWYLLNNLLQENKVQYDVVAHQNHLDKQLNPIPYIPGSTIPTNISQTDATVFLSESIVVDAIVRYSEDIKIEMKPTTLVYDPYNTGRLIMLVNGEVTKG